MEYMPEGHTMVNPDQALVHVGREEMLGYVVRV
jgi:hypothetical protein